MAASWAKKEKDEPDPPSEEEGESKWEMLKKKVLKEGKEESEDAQTIVLLRFAHVLAFHMNAF